jgi:hypothetical protein
MRRLLFLAWIALVVVGPAAGYRAPKYCTSKEGSANWCGNQPGNGHGYTCLHWHSDEEFCKHEDEPLPSCCWATEKDSGMVGCACCSSAGSKRIDLGKVGSYFHDRYAAETEYEVK